MEPASSTTETALKHFASGTAMRRTLGTIEAVDSDDEGQDRELEVHGVLWNRCRIRVSKIQ